MNILLTTGGQVNFPGLGLTMEKLIEGFNIFGIHISLSGILIAIAMFLGLFITEHLAKKTEQNTEHYLDLAIRLVIASVIGARIGYVLSHWQYFITDQGNVFDISDGGMSAPGAIIAGLIVSFIYCKQKKLSWLQVCDTSLPGIVSGQMVATMGCFFGRNMLGTYSDGTFAMQVALQDVDTKVVAMGKASRMITGNFIQVHPVALYEAAILLGLLIALLIVWKLKKMSGIILSVYLMVYGLMVFCMEFIRLDSQKISGSPFSIEHIVAAAMFLSGLSIFADQVHKYRIIIKAQPKNLNTSKNK